METRRTLRRWHMWLGWLVGIPMLLWTVSGMVMVAKPNDEVRGTALLRDPAPVSLSSPLVTPKVDGRAIKSLTLEPRAAGNRWVVRFTDGGSRLADPTTGALLPALGAADARSEVAARYRGHDRIEQVVRVQRADKVMELRRPFDGWKLLTSDGTHIFVDGGSGEIVAKRTRFWRFYDLMWGIHIMDLQGRTEPHNPWIVTFAALAMIMVLLAMVLLPMATRWRIKSPPRRS